MRGFCYPLSTTIAREQEGGKKEMKEKICPLLSDSEHGIECQYDVCEFFDKESIGCLFRSLLINSDIIAEQNES